MTIQTLEKNCRVLSRRLGFTYDWDNKDKLAHRLEMLARVNFESGSRTGAMFLVAGAWYAANKKPDSKEGDVHKFAYLTALAYNKFNHDESASDYLLTTVGLLRDVTKDPRSMMLIAYDSAEFLDKYFQARTREYQNRNDITGIILDKIRK